MEICECGCACGLMEHCSVGADCDCECHESDTLSCYEIVVCCKQIVPGMRVADVAGMSRNALFGWLNHESEFTAAQKEKISDLFNLRSRVRKTNAADFVVPTNIAQLVGNVQPVNVTHQRAKHDPFGTHHIVLQKVAAGKKPAGKKPAAKKTNAPPVRKTIAKKPNAGKPPKKAPPAKKPPSPAKKTIKKKPAPKKKACVDK